MPAEKEKRTRRKPGRVPSSCAECRRQKLKCDKNVPCEKCVSRGLSSLCPDRCLAPGKGNRMMLADTEELHDRIATLCARIRDLEDALRTAHGAVTDARHPLLHHSLLALKDSPGNPRAGSPPSPRTEPTVLPDSSVEKTEDSAAVVDAFGTLTIGSIGQSNFLGPSARSEYLIRASDAHKEIPNFSFPALSRSVLEVMASSDSPGTSTEACTKLGGEIFSKMPPLSEAIQLCEQYLAHGQYMYVAMCRDELFDDVLRRIYKHEEYGHEFPCTQGLSLLFIILALGALFDTSRAANCPRAHEYYMLSRSAQILVNPVAETTLTVIQTLIHMAQFLELSDWDSMASGTSWVLAGIATKLGYSIGLHLNSARWNVSAADTKKRTALFAQLFVLDTWQSFGFGRPPSIAPEFVDAGIPVDTQEYVDANQHKTVGYHHWLWQYTSVVHSMMSQAFGVKPPSYKVIVDLDRRIRDFPVPIDLRPRCSSQFGAEDVGTPMARHMQRWCIISTKEWTLLNLHRSYFARALQDRPQDLLKHRYAASVLATYRSAWRLIQAFLMPWELVPDFICRMSLAWSQTLSAAIIMCMLVTRAPHSTLTTSSLEELDIIAKIYEEAAPRSPAAAKNLKSIQMLRQKAHDAVKQYHSFKPQADEELTTSITPAELDRLSGKTHLIQGTPLLLPDGRLNPAVLALRSKRQTPCTTQAADSSTNEFANGFNVHSRIAEDMRAFDANDAPYPSTHGLFFDTPPESFPMEAEFETNGVAHNERTMPDGDDAANGFQNLQTFPGFIHNATAATGGFEQAQAEAPFTLDPGWQFFVEQLGF